MDWLVGWLVRGLVGWLVSIDVQGSWLMTGKKLVSIAPLIGKFFEDIAGAAAVVQVTTEVPLNFGGSAFNQKTIWGFIPSRNNSL